MFRLWDRGRIAGDRRRVRLLCRKGVPGEPVELCVQVEATLNAGEVGQYPVRDRSELLIEGLERGTFSGLQRTEFRLGCVSHALARFTEPVTHLKLTLRQEPRLDGAEQDRGRRRQEKGDHQGGLQSGTPGAGHVG
jgi:hypothetical protein